VTSRPGGAEREERRASGVAYTAPIVWEAIFLLVVLKVPVVYLGWVVWWAIRAVPEPPRGEDLATVVPDPEPAGPFPRPRRLPGPRPHRGRPHAPLSRRPARRTSAAVARGKLAE
jgi:hypothetical protein